MGPWDSDKEGQDANMASAPPESCISAEHGCVMFDCLAHLWDWLDPPITQSQFPMENKKTAPATQQPLTQQHLMAHHVHPDQIYQSQHTNLPTHISTQTNQIQPNGVMHQILQSQYHSNMNARSPLLENRHELYGTGHNRDYARHYGANDNYNFIQSPPVQERVDIHTDQNVNHDLLHNIPKGYNAEVYQDYLKRNPPKETNQIYQNHQPLYRPNVNQYSSKPYLPYSNRIGSQSNTELLRRQYNEIQQMKMQQQLLYQNQAQMHQQQKFAERQLLLQQIHGIQPPPNLQNSIYSEGSYRDIDRYSSKNDFKDYELQKDIEGYAKSKDVSESEKQIRQYHDTQWQTNPSSDFRETERFRKQENVKGKSQSPPTDFNNQIPKNNVGIISPMKSSESSTSSVKSPSSETRKSSSGSQALRSPIAQRVPSAPVAMSGVLYKQGSDGLKVWRKRWFVLSEYCLFYYKSQDEEKLLGSVLLPSYKVSACSAEDKVMRKFAFKLEHANMRTYILAALDQDGMTKWVKALTMATLMQNFNDQTQKPSDQITVKNEEGEEAGPTYANAPPKPRRSNEGYNSPSPDMYDPNYDLLKKPASHYSQGTNNTRYQDYTINPNQEATYTFTPQSPQSPPVQQQSQYQMKRTFDTHNLSLPLTNTITERLENNQHGSLSMYRSNPQSPYFDNRSKNQQLQQPNQELKTYKDQKYEQQTQRNPFINDVQKSESFVKDTDPQFKNDIPEQSRQTIGYNENYPETRTDSTPNVASIYNKDIYGELNRPNRSGSTVNERMVERRTPDAYGRAASLSGYNKEKVEDYEDIYANENEYEKAYVKSPKQHQARDNSSISSHKHPQDQVSNNTQEKTFSGPSVLRRKKMLASGIQPPMPRPYSADFLEYESKNEVINKAITPRAVCDPPRQPQRPKSSLDINSYYDPSSDRYYSEESYAEKMRQSAQYLQQEAIGSRNIQVPLAKYASGLAEKQLNSAYSQMTNNNYESELGLNRSSRDNVSYNSKYSDVEGLNSNWTLKEKETHKEYLNRSGSVMSDSSNVSGYVKDVNRFDSNAEGFMRSASARLPSSAPEKEGEKKIQQREESMKRLLEWKQRMLQSPLTRKSTPATISLAQSLNHSRQSLRSDQYKSKTFTNASYNSYSSDDEEETAGTDLQIPRNVQAGRSQNVNITSPIKMQPNTHAPFIALPDENVLMTLDVDKNDENTYENIVHPINPTFIKDVVDDGSGIDNSNIVTDDKINQDNNDCFESSDSEAESETYIEYTDHDLDEVLLASDTDCKNPEDLLLEESPNEDDVLNVIGEQFGEKSDTPPVRGLGEEHYLPMSPRKTSTIEPPHKTILQNLSVFDETMPQTYEDNPYVEMNLGNEEEDMQTYEVVCVNNGKIEPVYMEVKNGNDAENDFENVILRDKSISDTVSNFADTKQQTLKRVSKGDKCKEKSDCSDADDEASREISLDTPFNRMSISDNFRPASYYLTESNTMLYRQNSSDSETYLPPPVPSTSPPCEELSDEALSKYVLDKLDKSDIPQDSSILKMLTSENQNKINAKRKTTSLMIYGSRTSIHDTLTRGEKIRNSRASLANEKQNAKDVPPFSHINLRPEQNNYCSIDTDSLRSYNADRGSSRLSLDSDISSKFDMTSWNISSDVTSLGSESPMNLTNGSGFRDVEKMIRRRPLSDNSLFELNSSPISQQNDSISHVDLDKYLGNLQPFLNINVCENSYENTCISDSVHGRHLINDDAIQTQSNTVKHTRCSSTPVSNRNSNTPEDKNNNDSQYGILEKHEAGYIESQSSSSSMGNAQSPLSFYCKNNDEGTLLRKNLNKESAANKIKEFQNVKLTPKSGNDANTSFTGFHSRESSAEHSAPYYYSDLSSQEHINVLPTSHFLKNTNLHRKLNNQRRRGPLHKKNEISHIHNPIRNSQLLMSDPSFELASTARSVSVEFLSAADKDSDIDMKNIYESTGGKNSKIPESMNLISSLGCKRSSNQNSNDESQSMELCVNHVSLNTSLVQLSSASMSSHCSGNSSNTVYYDAEAETSAYENVLCQGEKHWDEDALWRDNLRRVSHRHARSMDDLDSVQIQTVTNRSGIDSCGVHSIKRLKKSLTNKVNRNVTYVNCEIQRRKDHFPATQCMYSEDDEKVDDNDVYVSLAKDSQQSIQKADERVYEQLTVGSLGNSSSSQVVEQKSFASETNRKQFEIDREKLRQWDLMSSGLMKKRTGGAQCVVTGLAMGEVLTDAGTDCASNEASTIMPGTNLESPTNNNTVQQTLSKKSFLGSNTSIGRSNRDANIPVRAVSPRVRWVEEKQSNDHYSSQQMSTSQQNLHTLNAGQDTWAITRSPSRTLQQPISAVSPRVRRNIDNDDLQWEKQPTGQGELMGDNPTAGELLGRTHEELVLLLIQLRRRHSATHRSIEQCCAQISSIEDCLSSLKAMEREESLQRLEQLKKQLMDLEHQYEKSKPLVQLVDNMVKLGSLYNRPGSTIERLERNQRLRQKVLAEHALEQQRWLESAAAGKSLETEAARARVAELWALEQELADEAAILQGLKTDKDTIDSLLTGVRSKLDSVPRGDLGVQANSSSLEAELTRVHAMLAHNSKKLEQTVADNARLERELQQLRRALQARRANAPTHSAHAQASHIAHPTALLENEVTRVQQLVSALQRQRQELSRAVRHLTQQSRALQTTHDAMPGKRRLTSSWQETNLDTGHTVEHGQSDYECEPSASIRAPGQYDRGPLNAPLYVDTRGPGADITSPLTSEDMQHNAFSNLSNVEKQEIKTVRIVKRESERRQRDRERSLQPMSDWPSSNITANLDQFLEEELVQPINYPRASSMSRHDYNKYDEYYNKPQNSDPNAYIRLSDKNMDLSPKFPSSPSLSNYDYSRDISSMSSSYNKSYDRSGYDRTISLSTQYLNSPTDSSRTLTNDAISKTSSIVSLTRSNIELSPIFKSEAAKQIITEVSDGHKNNGSLHRRPVPKEKRRHYTAPHHLSAKTLNEMPKDAFNQDGSRSLDDADMERALRGAAPDVVRSALPTRRGPDSIDQLLAAPQKIVIPERYIPEKPPELSPEEQQKRQEKVESIKKMLTDSSTDAAKSPDGDEKRQREHLLQMNQILAKQVTEMSKIIAVRALEELPLQDNTDDLDDLSPDVELPIYQQRDNFFT